jgi:hypothetical protein
METGGISRAAAQVSAGIDYGALAVAVRDGFAAAPAPQVSVADINKKQGQVAVVQRRARS